MASPQHLSTWLMNSSCWQSIEPLSAVTLKWWVGCGPRCSIATGNRTTSWFMVDWKLKVFPHHREFEHYSCCSVAKSCATLCNPMDCSRPDFSVLHYLQSLLKFLPVELMVLSNHLILCHPLLLLPSTFPSIRVFPNESALHIRWPKYWSFSFTICPSNEYSELISFRIDWFDLLAVQGILKSLRQHHSLKASIPHYCPNPHCSSLLCITMVILSVSSHLILDLLFFKLYSSCLVYGDLTFLLVLQDKWGQRSSFFCVLVCPST